jgi:hypothetical protein
VARTQSDDSFLRRFSCRRVNSGLRGNRGVTDHQIRVSGPLERVARLGSIPRTSLKTHFTGRTRSIIDSRVEPLKIAGAADGSAVVDVHHVVKNLEGQTLGDETVKHAFRLDGGHVRRFDIQGDTELTTPLAGLISRNWIVIQDWIFARCSLSGM